MQHSAMKDIVARVIVHMESGLLRYIHSINILLGRRNPSWDQSRERGNGYLCALFLFVSCFPSANVHPMGA